MTIERTAAAFRIVGEHSTGTAPARAMCEALGIPLEHAMGCDISISHGQVINVTLSVNPTPEQLQKFFDICTRKEGV